MALLDGKVILITGAGNGIGKATALACARAGARLVLNDLGTDRNGQGRDDSVVEQTLQAIEEQGATGFAVPGSVADETLPQLMVDQTVERFGRLDAVITCAGFLSDRTLLKASTEELQNMVNVVLKGTFMTFQAAAKVMKQQGSGSLIATTSTAGLLGNFGQGAYAAAAAGVYGLVRTASIELQRHAIRANAVAPLAKTRLTAELPMFEHVDSMNAEHVAPIYVYLASDLSTDLTGATLTSAGGRISMLRLTESSSQFKEADGGVWTAEELAEHFSGVRRS